MLSSLFFYLYFINSSLYGFLSVGATYTNSDSKLVAVIIGSGPIFWEYNITAILFRPLLQNIIVGS